MDSSNAVLWFMILPLGVAMWALVVGGIILGVRAIIKELKGD